MAFKTFTASTTLPASDINTYLMKQSVIVCTSATRPASPVQGECIYQTDTDSFKYWSGTIWDVFPGSLVARTTGANSVSSGAGTEIIAAPGTAGLGLATVSLSSTRPYRVEITGQAQTSGTLGGIAIRVRAATGTPTTGSTQILVGQAVAASTGANGGFQLMFSDVWTPASTGTWNLAVSCSGLSGSTWTSNNGQNPAIALYGA